jgi:hypothetical protein
MDDLESRTWDPHALRAHAASFSKDGFKRRIQEVVDDALGGRLPATRTG